MWEIEGENQKHSPGVWIPLEALTIRPDGHLRSYTWMPWGKSSMGMSFCCCPTYNLFSMYPKYSDIFSRRPIKTLAKGPHKFSKKWEHFGKGNNWIISISQHYVAKEIILPNYSTSVIRLHGEPQYLLVLCIVLLQYLIKNTVLPKYSIMINNFCSFTKSERHGVKMTYWQGKIWPWTPVWKTTVFLKLNQANTYLTIKPLKKQALTTYILSTYFIQGKVLGRSKGRYKRAPKIVPVSRKVTVISMIVVTTTTNPETPQ